MKEVRILMGMPVTVEVIDHPIRQEDIDEVFDYFKHIDEKFSTYKETSEITAINKGLIKEEKYSPEMKEVFTLSEETKRLTDGFFDIKTPAGEYDPSGLVKGWAIDKAAKILSGKGFRNFYINAGGDIQTAGLNAENLPWQVGIRDPLKKEEVIVKKVSISGQGLATSGTYERGYHIYNPHKTGRFGDEIVSLTVIGPDIYEADRFATAAFAMGKQGIDFIESLAGLEGYMIDSKGMATMTSGFARYSK